MTTALQIVNRAAELIGYKDSDEALSGNDAANFLDILNDIVDSWNTQRLYIVTVEENVSSFSSSPVTIGPGMTINVPRPVRIEDTSFIRINNIDYGLHWLEREEFNSITAKNVTGSFPVYAYYDDSMPTGSIYFWPKPTTTVELHLQLQQQLSAFADLNTDYTLAPGYKKAFEYTLAEDLAPGRRALDPQISRQAAIARKAIKVTNFESPQMNDGPIYLTPYARFVSGV